MKNEIEKMRKKSSNIYIYISIYCNCRSFLSASTQARQLLVSLVRLSASLPAPSLHPPP